MELPALAWPVHDTGTVKVLRTDGQNGTIWAVGGSAPAVVVDAWATEL